VLTTVPIVILLTGVRSVLKDTNCSIQLLKLKLVWLNRLSVNQSMSQLIVLKPNTLVMITSVMTAAMVALHASIANAKFAWMDSTSTQAMMMLTTITTLSVKKWLPNATGDFTWILILATVNPAPMAACTAQMLSLATSANSDSNSTTLANAFKLRFLLANSEDSTWMLMTTLASLACKIASSVLMPILVTTVNMDSLHH